MKEKIHLIMPMAGAGSRFAKKGFQKPKPLIEIEGKPFLYWSTKSIEKFVDLQDITFVVLDEHIKKFEIDKEIKKYFNKANIISIPKVLDGAVLTCLEGIKNINDTNPILFNDCDHMFKCNKFYEYCNKGEYDNIDGALLTFNSNEPKYSFLEIDEKGFVKRTVEKEPISNLAICGAYYFRNKKIFEETAEVYLKNCKYNEFFVSGLYNIMAQNNKKIKQFTVDFHIPFGTPEEYEIAMKTDKFKEFE